MALALKVREHVSYTQPFNISGQPAISLPLHWTADDLPVGIQFAAALGRDDMLLQLAFQLEEAMPWSERRAPHSVWRDI